MSDRRHVVANRDGLHHDHPASRCAVATKPGSATFPFPGVRRQRSSMTTKTTCRSVGEVFSRSNASLAFDAAHRVRGRPAVTSTRIGRGSKGNTSPGTAAKRDDEGYFWLLGRVDDIMLISGHNISTTEVESALVSHPSVAESAVVGRTDAVTGQAIAAFVTLRSGITGDQDLIAELRDTVSDKIGPIAKPASIVFTDDLPKTRSGKIMRRLLRDISEHRHLGDVTTLANADVVEEIAAKAREG